MEKSELRLECLKIAKSHLGVDETIAAADKYLTYCLADETKPSLPAENSQIPTPGIVKPADGVKELTP